MMALQSMTLQFYSPLKKLYHFYCNIKQLHLEDDQKGYGLCELMQVSQVMDTQIYCEISEKSSKW
jgi:hypothetical protein